MAHLHQLRTRLAAGVAVWETLGGLLADMAEASGYPGIWIRCDRTGDAATKVQSIGIGSTLLGEISNDIDAGLRPADPNSPEIIDELAHGPMAPWRAAALRDGFRRCLRAPAQVGITRVGEVGVLDDIRAPFADKDVAYVCLVASTFAPVLISLRPAPTRSHSFGVEPLLEMVGRHDPGGPTHARRVARYTLAIAAQVGLTGLDLDEIRIAAMLHDVGKIGVPESVLAKPGPLVESEWSVIRTHPEIGSNLLRHTVGTAAAAIPTLEHHERYDGGGYPAGLRGADINRSARIVAVADALDAMTSTRPYRDPVSFGDAVPEIQGETARQFDPEVVQALEAAIQAGTLSRDPSHDTPGLTLRRAGRDQGA